MNFKINGVETKIGGIFLADGKRFDFKVENIEDVWKLYYTLTLKNFDLAIITQLDFLRKITKSMIRPSKTKNIKFI